MDTGSERGTNQGIRGGCIALLLLWGADAACYFGTILGLFRCRGDLCGLQFAPLGFLLMGLTVLGSATAGLLALGAVLRRRDAISAAAVVLVLVVALLAGWVLWLSGHPGHHVLAAIYGVDPEVVGARPIAFYGSVVLICIPPALAWVAVRLAHGRAERIAAPIVLLATLVAQVFIRVAQ